MTRFDARTFGIGMAGVALLSLAPAAQAQPDTLSPPLAPIGFLVGSWVSEQGHAEQDQQARSTFRIEPAAGGKALLRQDHTEVLTPAGTPLQTFDQVMLVYPESGQLHADYFDGTHAIHYQQAQIEPGRSVRFTTGTIPGAPTFRLTYAKIAAERLSVRFEMMPPGQGGFHTIAEGTVRRTD